MQQNADTRWGELQLRFCDRTAPATSRHAMSSQPVVFQWLGRIGLDYAVDSFQALGITTPQALMGLTLEQYDALNIRDGA